MEKKYPTKDMVMPAEKVAFMLEAIDKLKASNKRDYESGEFDGFNHKDEGRYSAFEDVLQWLNPVAASTRESAQWVKATTRLPQHFRAVFVKIEGTKSVAAWHKDHERFVDDAGDFHPADQVEWLDERGEKGE